MKHLENSGQSQDSLFQHFQTYSGAFSNIKSCSGISRNIMRHIQALLRHLESYSELQQIHNPKYLQKLIKHVR